MVRSRGLAYVSNKSLCHHRIDGHARMTIAPELGLQLPFDQLRDRLEQLAVILKQPSSMRPLLPLHTPYADLAAFYRSGDQAASVEPTMERAVHIVAPDSSGLALDHSTANDGFRNELASSSSIAAGTRRQLRRFPATARCRIVVGGCAGVQGPG
jgi:hypothetical protein